MAKIIVLLALIAAVSAKSYPKDLVNQCRWDDIECLRQSTTKLFEKTASGISEYELEAIDPLVVGTLDYELAEFGVAHHFTNLQFAGVKNSVLKDFKLDTANSAFTVTLELSVDATGDIGIEYYVQPESKTVDGSLAGFFKLLVTITHPFSVVQGDDGEKYIQIGDAEVTSQSLNEPSYSLGDAYEQAIEADPQLSEVRDALLASEDGTQRLWSAVGSEFAKAIVATLDSNLKQAAALLPASAFFKNF